MSATGKCMVLIISCHSSDRRGGKTMVDFAMGRIATGVRLHYAEQGDREGEAIIFIHAYADSWFSFSRVLNLLSPQYHAFAPDKRGHGQSDRPRCCYAADDLVADIVAFMDAVGLEVAALVGHSSGGMIAQRAALTHPDRVSHLVMIDSAATLLTNEVVVRAADEIRALRDPISPNFIREFQEGAIFRSVPEEFMSGLVSESLKVPARVWRDYYDGVVLTIDHSTRLREITAPTLVVLGERDSMFTVEEQARLVEAIPDATLKVYPQTGHSPNWERPEWLARDLEAFIESR
jgi:non-heme chloroperoxidase